MTIELGGNIVLTGFRERDPAELVVIKKIVGNYARKFADNVEGYESLHITMKPVGGEKAHKFEVNARLMHGGKLTTSEVVEINLFVCVSDVLKKLENQLIK
jgi:ribosome-associated translation inhibitor RaiA